MKNFRLLKGEKKNKKLISLILTGFIISLLIFSGPAAAVTVSISNLNDINQGSSVNFLLNIDFDEYERIPISNITIVIKNASTGVGLGTYAIDLSGNVISGSGISVIPISNSSAGFGYASDMYANGTLYGYGYGYDTGYTNFTWGYGGFGYGYTQGVATGLQYNITITDSTIINTPGSYSVDAYVYTDNTNKPLYSLASAATFTVSTVAGADYFSFSGYTKHSNTSTLAGTNATIEAYLMVPGQGPSLVDRYSALSNGTGFFNITGIASNSSYFYKPIIKYYQNSNVTYMGQSLPSFPLREMTSLGTVKFYLKEAATLNITAFRENGSAANFNYMVKDQTLGYPIAEQFTVNVPQATVYVPADRNYSIMVYPQMAMPVSYDLNNLQENETSPLVNIAFNLTERMKWVSGTVNYNGGTDFDYLRVVPFLLEPGNMVAQDYPMPYNMSAWRWPQKFGDSYDESAGYYNITLIGSAMNAEILLFVTARNNSEFYGGFKNISLSTTSADIANFNFTLQPLLGSNTTISQNDGGAGGTVDVYTRKKSIRLRNSTGSTPNNAFIELELNYTSLFSSSTGFSYMLDVGQADSGVFSVPLVNYSIKKINIYTNDFAPKKTSLTQSQLQPSSDITNITLAAFNPGGINETIGDLYIDMVKSNVTCNVPSPPGGCSLLPSTGLSDFSPLTVVIGGGDISFRMKKFSNNITVHYNLVDLLASGPPDAIFDSSSTNTTVGGALAEAWRFGSTGPTIYSSVLIGVPYNESSTPDSFNFTVRIPYLYDDSWNVIWNISANTLAEIPNGYSDYLNDPYSNYLDNSKPAMPCSKSNTTAICYVDTTNNLVWMKIPHFSGVAPQVIANQPPTVTVNRPVQNEIYSVTNGSSGYGAFVLSYNVSDDSGFQNVVFNISYNTFIAGNPPYLNSNTTLSDANYQNNSIAMKDGTYSLVIHANDTSGSITRVYRNFVVNTSYYTWFSDTQDTTISDDAVLAGNNSLTNSNISGSSFVINCTITNSSVVVNATVNRTIVQNSSVENATLVDSTIQSGSIINASSTLTNATVKRNSTITRSVMSNVVITNVTAVNTTLTNANVSNATIINNVIASGSNATIILNESGIVVNFSNVYRSTNISDLIEAVNVTNVSSLSQNQTKEVASNTSQGYTIVVNTSQNLNNVTIKVALTGISPTGQPLENMVGSKFLYIEAAGMNASLNNATITMKVNGSGLTNAWCVVNTSTGWEYTNRSTSSVYVSFNGTHVTCNVTHFSVFGLQGYTTPTTTTIPTGGGGGYDRPANPDKFTKSFGIIPAGKKEEISVAGHNLITHFAIMAKNFIGAVSVTGKIVDQPGISIPEGLIYKYIDLQSTVSELDIDYAELDFYVTKAWINDKNIDPDTVKLQRYSNGKWSDLETVRKSEDSEKINYSATTPGFSYFAVTGDAIAEVPPEEELPPEVEVPPEIEKPPEVEMPPEVEKPLDKVDEIEPPEEKEGLGKIWYLIAAIIIIAGIAAFLFRDKIIR